MPQKSARRKIFGKIVTEHPILPWLCEHASYLLNRLEVGRDGKTAYERSKGKRATVLGLEFGEKMMWKLKPTGLMQKLETQWHFGLFIGVRQKSGEVIVAADDGEIKMVRTVRRVPLQTRWVEANLAWVRFVPWNLGAGDALAEGSNTIHDVKSSPGTKMRLDEVEEILLMRSRRFS